MDQIQTVDNDLQKAIDDITKSTNGDPLFADPVAAPAPAVAVQAQSVAAEVPAVLPAAPRPTVPQ